MKQLKKHSLSFYLYALTIALAVSVAALFALTTSYSLSALRRQTNEVTQVTLSLYGEFIEESFSNAESFLSGFGYNDEDIGAINGSNTLTRYVAVSREQTKITEAIPSYSKIDGFFFYNPQNNIYACAVQSWVSSSESNSFRDKFKIEIDNGELEMDGTGNWITFSVGGRYYLLRMIWHKGTYVGAFVNINNLLSSLENSSVKTGKTYLYQKSGTALSVEANENFNFDPLDAANGYQMVDGGQSYLAISHSVLSGSYYFVTMVPDSSIRARMSNSYKIAFLVGVLLILLVLSIYIVMRNFFILPMHRLSMAIRKLRDGNLGVTFDESAPVVEFQDVKDSFNEMSSEIHQLTISVYEQRLKRLRIHQEYLKQQITPHFYINCLNTIYSLAGLGKNDLVRELSKELSQHLRYTMNSKPSVELCDEIEHVNNYISLTELRYPHTMVCDIYVDNAVKYGIVPPLSLQSLVENTVKHELVMGEEIKIHLSAEDFLQGNEKWIHINYWDSGRGYSQEMLEKWKLETSKDPDEFVENDGFKIGMFNMIQRFQMLFNNQAQICFSNKEGAGAQCDILIPYKTLVDGEEDEKNDNSDRR